jgi:hypothetical protein
MSAIRPKYLHGEPMWSQDELTKPLMIQIKNGGIKKGVVKKMDKDHGEIDEALTGWSESLHKHRKRMLEAEVSISKTCKSTSSGVRSATNSLGEALVKMEKTCNFDKLERYVGLLERASVAIDSMAELEKTGKLERIFAALK